MNKLFLIFVVVLTLSSCASFSDSYTDGNTIKLNSKNLNQLSGNYKIYAVGKYDEKGHYISISSNSDKYRLDKKIENKFPNIKDRKDIDKIIKSVDLETIPFGNIYDQVEVKIEDKYIFFNLLKNNESLKVLNFEGKLKNGFFYLPKEKNCVKIPTVVNGCIKSQRRVGLAKDGSLIIHEYNDVNTSSTYTSVFLSLVEGNGDAVYKYKKVK